MCLNGADFAKNVSFKSYAAVRLPRRPLIGHILVWERVHAPWAGIPGLGHTFWQYHSSKAGRGGASSGVIASLAEAVGPWLDIKPLKTQSEQTASSFQLR